MIRIMASGRYLRVREDEIVLVTNTATGTPQVLRCVANDHDGSVFLEADVRSGLPKSMRP